MADGRPVVVADFSMRDVPERLARVAYGGGVSYPFREDYLQWLLDTTPDLLPVREFYPTVSSLCSLGREIPVDLGGKQGYIDNIVVTNDAHLVLIETKLFRNPEGIREVVAQVYDYGRAVAELSYVELEAALRKGMKGGSELRGGETIALRVRTKEAEGSFVNLIDDFEDRLAMNIRRGEVLYLIVADGIRTSVERLAIWLNEIAGSAPHRFGLVELRAYATQGGHAVIVPRTVMRTKEVSRHVVVIETRNADAIVSTVVEDRTGKEYGGVSITSRQVAPEGPLMTKERLLDEVRTRMPSSVDVVNELIDQLEAGGFDSRPLGAELQYGFTFPTGDGEFTPLVSLLATGLYSNLRAKMVGLVGNNGFADYKARLRLVGPFYKEEEVHDPSKKFGHSLRYDALAGRVGNFSKALDDTRAVLLEALHVPASS